MSNIMGSQVTDSTMIGIKDRTNLLDMPPELRIKVCLFSPHEVPLILASGFR